jgi:hypothetical protein
VRVLRRPESASNEPIVVIENDGTTRQTRWLMNGESRAASARISRSSLAFHRSRRSEPRSRLAVERTI